METKISPSVTCVLISRFSLLLGVFLSLLYDACGTVPREPFAPGESYDRYDKNVERGSLFDVDSLL